MKPHPSPQFRRAIGLACVWLSLLTAVGRAELSVSDRLVSMPVNAGEAGPNAEKAMEAYARVVIDAVQAIDAVLEAPGEDASQAAEKVSAEFTKVRGSLNEIFTEAEKFVGNKPMPSQIARWLQDQRLFLGSIEKQTVKTAQFLARTTETDAIYRKNWVPKIREKKKTFRSLGEQLNKEYNTLRAALDARKPSDQLRPLADAFEATLTRAKALESSLLEVRDNLVDGVKRGDPTEVFKTDWEAAIIILDGDLATRIPDWMKIIEVWVAYRDKRYFGLRETFDTIVESSESLRVGTLFRELDKPLRGLAYNKIHSTFKDLLDEARRQL